jgi:hypothetical protein
LKNGYGSYVLKKAIENKMSILGIKSMTLTEKQKGDDVKHPKAWYHPIEDKNLAHKAFKYTLLSKVDVIEPPGNINHIRWVIDNMNMDLKMTQKNPDELEKIAKKMIPLFPLKAR